ncbi:MAG: FAD/NAD(P)-binding protein [Acidobacteriota bacterium]
MRLDWLIVGGGIHGVHIAARLIADAGVDRKALRIVDPGQRLLSRWRTCTAVTGMKHLRSPVVHHIDLEPWALENFAGDHGGRALGLFAAPYDRPALDLFNDHCDHVVETFGLADLHIRDRATTCSVDCDQVTVQLASGQAVTARNIVLALGAGERPEWPDWAPREDERIAHVFDPDFDRWPDSPETVAVVGGGISAGQVALRLLDEGHRAHLVSRHPLRRHQFDSDPGWLGPKFMTDFSRERNYDRRRALITEARHKGSVPPDVYRALRRAIDDGQLLWHKSEVLELDGRGPEALALRLSTQEEVAVNRVLLATGFAATRPGGSLVDDLIASASLPCAGCGFPIVDSGLRWHPRVHVSGPLAELELGPVSRNIAGARRAGNRLVDAVVRPSE